MKNKVWVITQEINDYNQHGSYFIAAFINKPTIEELRILNPTCEDAYLEHLLSGGGRIGSENSWQFLKEVTTGVSYEEGPQ